jgi:hypothetical protein
MQLKSDGFNAKCTDYEYAEYTRHWTASAVYWSDFLATGPEVSGSIPGATRFSE